jgi:membrane protein DedA with SNARE-associated domain
MLERILLQLSTAQWAYSFITSLVASHGYLAVFILMLLESASLPVPSEVVLPLAGYFIAKGTFDFSLVLVSALIGGLIGMAVDYYIAFFIEKDVVYRYAKFFHIKREMLEGISEWFERNGAFTVFVSRLVPALRSLISLPAGFAKMDQKRFFFYSFAGSLIWDIALIAFGYYTLSLSNTNIVSLALIAFAVVVSLIYLAAVRMLRKKR